MKYYKQFHNWPYVHLVALLFGCVCLSVAFVWGDFSAKVSMLACGVFAFIAAGVLWKGRRHYLEINQDWIVHHGFQKWQLKKTDLQRVETGQKGWTEDYDPYLKIYIQNRHYHVDNGFLIMSSGSTNWHGQFEALLFESQRSWFFGTVLFE